MRILVKIGGAQLEHPAARDRLAAALAKARTAGHELIVVHGGGKQIVELSGRLGLEPRYHEGLRITDGDTAAVALMVLGGAVNRQLVASLQRAGVPAAGLTGADGATFSARPHRPGGADLGFVGAVAQVRPDLVQALLASGHVPVLATVAPGGGDGEEAFYNINADQAAAPLARAFAADALLFLTDVPGVLDADGSLLPSLDEAQCQALQDAGTAHGGMIPKLRAALRGAAENPGSLVKIAPADGADSLLEALQDGVGTRFRSAQEKGHG